MSVTVAAGRARVGQRAAHFVELGVNHGSLGAHPAYGVERVAQASLTHAHKGAELGDRYWFGRAAQQMLGPLDDGSPR